MKKLISFLLSVALCGSMLTIIPAASWDNALCVGDESAKLTEPDTRQQEDLLEGVNKVELDIPYDAPAMRDSNDEIKQGKDLLNDSLRAEIEKLNPYFATDYFKVTQNTYGSSLQTVTLFKIIPTEFGNVMTTVNYVVSIRDGVAFLLTYSDQPTVEMMSKEDTVSGRIENFVAHGGEDDVEAPEIPNAQIEVDEDHVYYAYDYATDELSYVVGYEATHLDADGVLSAHEVVVQVPRNENKQLDQQPLFLAGMLALVLVGLMCLIIFVRKKKMNR